MEFSFPLGIVLPLLVLWQYLVEDLLNNSNIHIVLESFAVPSLIV